MGKIFVTSDTHFNHKNIIEYCKRPFKDTLEMNEYIIEKWNSVVKDEDIVYAYKYGKYAKTDMVLEVNGSCSGSKSILSTA